MLSEKAMRNLAERATHLSKTHRIVALVIIIGAVSLTAACATWCWAGKHSVELSCMVTGVGLLVAFTSGGLYREWILSRQAKRIAMAAREWPKARIQALLEHPLSWRLRDAIEKLLS